MTDHGAVDAGPTRGRLRAAFSGLLLLMLLASLDQTIVATALPTVVGELGSLTDVSWVVTSYLLGAAATTPVWGKLGDLLGRKRVLLATVTIFLVGSALCGFAQDIGQLIAFRAFQGVGAGGMMALAMATVGDLVSPRERGRYQGYIAATFAVATVVGPLAGGFLVDNVGWRWIFYVNLPIGAIALGVLGVLLVPQAGTRRGTIDYPGAVLIAGAVVCLLLMTTWGGGRHAWGSPTVLGLAVGTLVLGGLFLWQETRASDPILPLRLFRNPVIAVVSVTLFLATLAFFAAIVYVPLWLQVVTGVSATSSGLLLVPMMIGVLGSTLVSGRLITRTGRYKIFPVLGLALSAVAMLLFSTMAVGTSRWVVAAYMVLLGVGFGMVTQVLVLAVQNTVDRSELGTATAATSFFRVLGGAIGVAVFGAVLNARLSLLPDDLSRAGVQVGVKDLLSSPDRIHALPPPVGDVVIAAVQQGLHGVFLVAVPFAVVGFVVVLGLVETPLRSAISNSSVSRTRVRR